MNRRILSLLLNEPDISQKEIAKRLKVSPPAVTNRVQRMKKDGIIKGFVPLIDLGKAGFELNAIVWARVKNGNLVEARKLFATDPNVCSVYSISGEYDLAVFARFRDTEDAEKWSQRILSRADMIQRTNTSFVIEAVRERIAPNDLSVV